MILSSLDMCTIMLCTADVSGRRYYCEAIPNQAEDRLHLHPLFLDVSDYLGD